MSDYPQIPAPAHTLAETMMSRRFGRETVNYFSSKSDAVQFNVTLYLLRCLGSPLNRLSFLRTEHPFLSAAIRHPATRFVLLKDLAPLTKSPSELYYAQHDEVKKLVPDTIYDKSEEDTIKEFDSRKTSPTLIFLGMDESRKQDGLTWNIYKGAPFFALDVTPKGSEEQQTNTKDLISAMEAKGLSFLQARVVMSLSADEGMHHSG
jgi:NAD+ diphosphatase